MRDIRRKSKESGMALLLAIFTLLLLSALGLTLLCAADLETNIAANYRDKQMSVYASLSGLQEARDRLIPSRCDVPLSNPTCNDTIALDTRTLDLPTTSTQNVIYILNPANGETVKPWDTSAGNKYFDTELCQENILGLASTNGLCPASAGTSMPTVASSQWTQIYDDSTAPNTNEYHPVSGSSVFASPLPYKWVRVSLKTARMTPRSADGSSTGSGPIMCWDGKYQVPLPSGYKSDCSAIDAIQLAYTNGTLCGMGGTLCTFSPALGSNYTNPVVTIGPPSAGGIQATATAHVTTVSTGTVSTINITNPGSGYASAPTVTLSGGGGSGATATATVSSITNPPKSVASLSAVTQTSPIGCYQITPISVSISGGGGSGATAAVIPTVQTCIVSMNVSGSCTGNAGQYKNKTISLYATGGDSSFAATITTGSTGSGTGGDKTYPVSGLATITNPGSGYTSATTIDNQDTNCSLSATITTGYQVQSLNLTNGGANYTSVPAVTISGPTVPAASAPPTATATLSPPTSSGGQVIKITITNPGSGYSSAPTVSFSAPTGTCTPGPCTTAAATATLGTTGDIDTITLTKPGSGYTSNPTVTITDSTGPGGTGLVMAKASTGSTMGRVYMLTALAVARGGSRTMSQMEVATPPAVPITMPGALTIDAFSPNILPSHSQPYYIHGNDGNNGGAGCGTPALPPKSAVGVIDNPFSPTNPTAVACVTSVLGGTDIGGSCSPASGVKTTNYTNGSAPTPDVQNVYASLGPLTTPAGADALASALIKTQADAGGTPLTGPITLTTTGYSYPSNCPITVVKGDLQLKGNNFGCGPLLVTGNLTMDGNYSWNGPIFVIGSGGSFTGGGGGNGQITGSLFVAKTCCDANGNELATLGTPTVSFDISGGGGNTIQYDHCFSDAMLSALKLNMPPSDQPLKVLSLRTLY